MGRKSGFEPIDPPGEVRRIDIYCQRGEFYCQRGESGGEVISSTIVVAHVVFVHLYYAGSTVPSWDGVGGKADQSLQGEICLAFL